MIDIENGAQVQKRRGKNKTYLNRENHCVFTERTIRSNLELICLLKSTLRGKTAQRSLQQPKTTELFPSSQSIMQYRSKIMI